MGRLTEAIVYLNSTSEDWKKGRIHGSQFKSITIDDEAKKARRKHLYYFTKGNKGKQKKRNQGN